MSDTERQALTLSLLGTGKPGDPPGPLHPGWVVRNLAGTRTTLQRWRKGGIPPDRLEDVLAAVAALSGQTKDAPPDWARRMAIRIRAMSPEISKAELAQAEAAELAEEALRAAGGTRRPRGSGGAQSGSA